ncbi:MAG TPA: protein-glutamate O-methyltransferase CheR [Methylophilaceae bacterium]|nr:protein-glutamate O-methyltransferase CheR [Methylophilaceae bacterium]
MTTREKSIGGPGITEQEFNQFREMIFRIAGISMSPAKKTLVAGRLGKRLKHHGLTSYKDYYSLISKKGSEAELQIAIDLLTTNETHFFREPKHFDYVRDRILPTHPKGRAFRVWSAASSSGEEPYSIAMQLADLMGDAPWEIVASDLSTQVLEKARRGIYPMQRAEEIPRSYLTRFCMKGTGSQTGTMMISRELRTRVRFMQINLNAALPDLGEFDVIFLRNVMIYFDNNTKREVVHRMLPLLKPDGHLLIGHSESLNGVTDAYRLVVPSVYRK